MKVYIAHNFAARDWLKKEIIPLLKNRGYEVTSRWIWDDSHIEKNNKEQSAIRDLQDIDEAQGLIIFLDQFADRPGKGKFVEMGYALGSDKDVITIGKDLSCVFTALPQIIHYETIDDFLNDI